MKKGIVGNTTSYVNHSNNINKPSKFYAYDKNNNKYEIRVSNKLEKERLKKNFKTGAFVKIDGLIMDDVIFVTDNNPNHKITYLNKETE